MVVFFNCTLKYADCKTSKKLIRKTIGFFRRLDSLVHQNECLTLFI